MSSDVYAGIILFVLFIGIPLLFLRYGGKSASSSAGSFLGFIITMLIVGGVPIIIAKVFNVSESVSWGIFIVLIFAGGAYLTNKNGPPPKDRDY